MLPHGGVKQSGWVRLDCSTTDIRRRILTIFTGSLQRTLGSGRIPEDQNRYLRGIIRPPGQLSKVESHENEIDDSNVFVAQLSEALRTPQPYLSYSLSINLIDPAHRQPSMTEAKHQKSQQS
jgi:hypothetical protein